METETNSWGETPEQVSKALSDALDRLGHEADAFGMPDVSELIEQARAKLNEYRSSH